MKYQIYLKPLTIDVLDSYLELVNDPEVRKLTEPHQPFKPFTRKETETWLSQIPKQTDRADFAIFSSSDDQFVGEVVLNEVQNQSANIRIALKTKFQNKGYGREAMQLAIDYGFQKMNLMEITLSVFKLNPHALHVYEKLGFIKQGSGQCEGFDEIYMSLKGTR